MASEITGERKSHLLIENENTPSIYETWRGSGCALHDTEKYMGQGPKTLSLLSIMLHTEKGHRHARDSLYWIQMSPKRTSLFC